MAREIDPTRLEVIRNALEGIADTMAISLYQTARSAVVRLGWDFSTAVLSAEGDLVGQGMCHPVHLGGMMPALAGCLAYFGDDIHPEDILITNDPYEGAQHLPDIYLFKPVFHDGAIAGHVAAICHHADIGGAVPGGQGYDNTEIYQEGLRIPPLKLYERGEADETIYRLLDKAVRAPDMVKGDLLAQVTATKIGEAGLLALIERTGVAAYHNLVADLLDYTERLTRRAIVTLPDGTWSFTDYVDNDGISEDTIEIVATVTKSSDEIHVDFDGTSPQCRGSIVGLFHMNTNFVHMALRCLLGADLPSTAGFFRPFTITAPEGCFVNPRPPAAVAARQLGGRRINQAVWGALAQMAPDGFSPARGERIPASPSPASTSTRNRGADGCSPRASTRSLAAAAPTRTAWKAKGPTSPTRRTRRSNSWSWSTRSASRSTVSSPIRRVRGATGAALPWSGPTPSSTTKSRPEYAPTGPSVRLGGSKVAAARQRRG